jgi:hypothetical protein
MSDQTTMKLKRAKSKSRGQRWSDACQKAIDGLEELEELRCEYEEWQGNLPENLQSSPLGEKLEAVVSLDFQSAIDTAQEADGLDLPLGFGRD